MIVAARSRCHGILEMMYAQRTFAMTPGKETHRAHLGCDLLQRHPHIDPPDPVRPLVTGILVIGRRCRAWLLAPHDVLEIAHGNVGAGQPRAIDQTTCDAAQLRSERYRAERLDTGTRQRDPGSAETG